MRCPLPMAPVWVMFSAKLRSSGMHCSSTLASPPTKRLSRPSSASLGVRVMGASRNMQPACSTALAMRSVESGSAVEQSITTAPLRRADSAPASPSAPSSTASTWGEPVTHSTSTSADFASSVTDAAVVTPSAFRRSSGWLPGWSSTVSAKPLRAMFRAMPWPIRPTPARAMRGELMVFIFLLEKAKNNRRASRLVHMVRDRWTARLSACADGTPPAFARECTLPSLPDVIAHAFDD
ncbi:hypothetical protein SDC9_151488 [bioreactor metagenome]|uniref:Uncharacterized protein n=1 Tax=bioreactor metagenome TaxID=1076179 RepID=A0A645ESJ1_9ZZZZ